MFSKKLFMIHWEKQVVSTASHADHNELSIHLFVCIWLQVTEHLTNSGFNNRNISSFHTTDGGLFRIGSVAQLCPPGSRLLPFCRLQHVGYVLPHGHKTVAVAPGITSSHLSIQEGRMGVGGRIKWAFYSSTCSWPPDGCSFLPLLLALHQMLQF